MAEVNRIFLMGYMGCGKSTLGKKLAHQLNWQFIDLDEKIESDSGKSIPEIFSESGEQVFRVLEANALLDVSVQENAVISLGGGTPCQAGNLDIIKDKGSSIYIQLPPKVLADRLKQAKEGRPLIAGKSDEELLDFIEEQLGLREPYYMQADFQINGIGISPETVIKTVQLTQAK